VGLPHDQAELGFGAGQPRERFDSVVVRRFNQYVMAYKRYASDAPLSVTANIEFTSIERTIDSVFAKKAIKEYSMRRPNGEELKSLTFGLFRQELYCERFECIHFNS